jgi:hypothetical protein
MSTIPIAIPAIGPGPREDDLDVVANPATPLVGDDVAAATLPVLVPVVNAVGEEAKEELEVADGAMVELMTSSILAESQLKSWRRSTRVEK